VQFWLICYSQNKKQRKISENLKMEVIMKNKNDLVIKFTSNIFDVTKAGSLTIVFVIAFLAFAINFTSCKKDELTEGNKQIEGTWKFLGEQNFTTIGENAEIKLKNGILYIAYKGVARPGSNSDTTYFHVQKFQEGKWQFLTDEDLPGYTSMNMDPSIEIDDNSNVYLSFSARKPSPNPGQNFISPLKVYKYDGSSWTQLGNALHQEGFGSDLAISPNNKLFCSYVDAVYEGNPWDNVYLYTQKWNGSSWEEFGGKTNKCDDFAETIADNEYVYNFAKVSGNVAIYRNNGSMWTPFGLAIENGGDTYSMQKNIFIDQEGTLYVSAQYVLGTGEGRENRVFKQTKSSTQWEQVGDAVKYSANYVSLAISPSNELYMGYIEIDPLAYPFHENHDQYDEETSIDSRFTVRKFDGEKWIVVGKQGFTSRTIVQSKIAADDNKIYAMFRESTKQYSVMVFEL
jgi:hypothetical protein